jgi:hypothetical protein
MQAWLPEYIAVACPFVACTLIGPALENVRAAQSANTSHKATRNDMRLEMIKLILKQIGKFWDIGSSALRKFLLASPESPIYT